MDCWRLKTFQHCVQNAKHEAGEQRPKKGIAKVRFEIPVYRDCTGEFLSEHGEAVTATFTVVLAISTIVLWAATRDAAGGGERAANIAEQTLTELERALVSFKEMNLFAERGDAVRIPSSGTIIGGQIRLCRVSAVLENGGGTPATRMIYNFNCGKIQDDPGSFDFPDGDETRRGVLGPRATLQTPSRVVDAKAIAEIIAGRERWFIWGCVDYDDIFEDTSRHRTEFCFEMTARKLPNGEVYIGFPMYDRFNAYDGDCMRQPQPFERA